ncbi:MAG: prepilin-type N-terminal cleavage/methylation domain-containing protein [Candidatus Methylomirabilia bacterium]
MGGDRGFTAIEVLIAIGVLTIALVGVAGTAAIQSGGIGGTFPFGQAAVTRGHYVSTATFLAQERLEQLKRLQYTLTNDEYGADPIPTGFADESPVSGYPNFSRQVRVQTSGNTKTITVTVTYSLPTATGINQEGIVVSTLVAARP